MSDDNKKILQYVLIALSLVIALIGSFFGIKLPYTEIPDTQIPAGAARGIMGELSGDIKVGEDLLVVGDVTVGDDVELGTTSSLVFEGATDDAYETTLAVTDPTADRTINLPNMSGTVLVTNTPKILAFGTNTVTTTLTLSHGITGPTQVFCTLTQDSEANGATCSATISSDTIVLKLWKADGATAGSVGKQIAWMVVGPGQ